MPAVAPRKIGVDECLCLGTVSLAWSRHGFSSRPTWDGSSANDEIGCSSVTTHIQIINSHFPS